MTYHQPNLSNSLILSNMCKLGLYTGVYAGTCTAITYLGIVYSNCTSNLSIYMMASIGAFYGAHKTLTR
jgi:hypothetical protein